MIHEADESLVALFADAEFGYKSPAFSFEAPTAEWRGKQAAGPVVNLFLHHVVEMVESRVASSRTVRDTDGRVSERRPPVRRYELAYLVSAWAANVEEEHRLLGDVLRHLAEWESLPPQYRRGSLAQAELPIPMFVGTPVTGVAPANRWDIWGTLGGGAKTSFDLVLSVPLIPRPDVDIGPPAESRRFDFGLVGTKAPGDNRESLVSPNRDTTAGARNAEQHQAEVEAERRAAEKANPPAPAGKVRSRIVREGPAPAQER
ncbi:MAG TPA: DUF4255 domain-containing protein [Acidimicrobiales bacterium]